MDAVGWIFPVGLVPVLAGYVYQKKTDNRINVIWHDLTKSNKASSNPH
jgi:hypothetical protein